MEFSLHRCRPGIVAHPTWFSLGCSLQLKRSPETSPSNKPGGEIFWTGTWIVNSLSAQQVLKKLCAMEGQRLRHTHSPSVFLVLSWRLPSSLWSLPVSVNIWYFFPWLVQHEPIMFICVFSFCSYSLFSKISIFIFPNHGASAPADSRKQKSHR